MSRLTSEKCPELTEETLKILNKVGINTVLEFISDNVQNLSERTGLSSNEMFAIRRSLLIQNSAITFRGDQLFEQMIHSLRIIPTGCANLDQLLGGGLYSKEVTEIFGSPAVGKTQSCLSIACHVAFELKKNIIYIDTGGAFSGKRIEEIFQKRYEKHNKMGYANSLTRIQCIKAFDIHSVVSVLEGVLDSLSVQDDAFYQDVVLVMVDSVASVISPILGGTQNHGHALMVNLARILKSLAMDYNLAVLVTNNVVSDFAMSSYTKPALGKTWSHIPNNRVHLYHNCIKQPSQRLMKLTKSCRMPLKVVTTAVITEGGLTSAA